MRILIVEDHREVSDLVARALVKDGNAVKAVAGVVEADEALAEGSFDIVVLDLGLPDGGGLDWCLATRARGVTLPILVLTAQSGVPTRVAVLDAGADDFLGKPFAVAELRARVRALLRRTSRGTAESAPAPSVVEKAGAHLDFGARRAHVNGTEVPLTAREWIVLELLLACRGRVATRSHILSTVWGEESESADASLEVIVARIRKKLGSTFIRTVRGEGYAVE